MKFTGPVHFHWYGDKEAAKGYIPTARLLLGRCSLEMFQEPKRYPGISDSAMHKRLEVTSADYMVRNRTFPNGVAVRVILHHEGMAAAHIFHPTGAPEVDAIEIRGLLRAIQAEVDYECTENPTPEEIAAAAELETPIEPFSTLETLHDPNDAEKQWLVYPDGLSIEFNAFSNHVLPPQGGTFIMDTIAAPFNPIAFDINGKPPLTDCKMLVTGGGTVQEDGSYMFGEVVEGVRVRELTPRVFRVGRKNEMPGWPWADKRDPEAPFGRLVSLSAVLEHTPNVAPNAHRNKVTFTLTFLKLNGAECTDEDEENDYVCLDPVEVVVELDDSLYNWEAHPYDATHWVDFAVLSLLPDGSRVVIGMNQIGQAGYIGVCYDFVVLDLARIIADPLDFDFYSRFDTWKGSTLRSVSSTAALTNIPYTYEGPLTGDLFPHSPEDIAITPKGDNYTVSNRQRTEYANAEQLGGKVFPASRTINTGYDFDTCIYMHFGNNGELYETYVRAQRTSQVVDTQSITHSTFNEDTYHDGIPYVRTNWWGSGQSYSRGSIVSYQQTLAGVTVTNVYITLSDHTSSTANGPGLEWDGSAYVDRLGSAWKMVFGNRMDGEGCSFAFWNGVDDCYDNTPDTCEAYDEISHIGTFDATGGLWLGDGGAEPVLIWYTYNPTFYGFDYTVVINTATTVTQTTSIYQRKLDLEAADIFLRDFAAENLILQVVSDSTSTQDVETFNQFTKQCTVLAPTGYRSVTHRRSKQKQTHFLSDTASEDGLTHSGVDYAFLPFPLTYDGQVDGGLPKGLLEAHAAEASYKASPFVGGNFGVVEAFPVGGIGWLVSLGARSGSLSSTQPSTTTSITLNGSQKNKCVLTVGSKWAFTTVDETNPWEPHSLIEPLQPDVENGPSFTDPLPYIQLVTDNEGDPEAVLKPVRGPEKGVACKQQQISYVGWLYPQELEAPEE
jgi:hypothetical protein